MFTIGFIAGYLAAKFVAYCVKRVKEENTRTQDDISNDYSELGYR